MLESNENSKDSSDEVELLTLLIEKWDIEHTRPFELNPVEILNSLMHDHNLKAKDMVTILGVSKGLVSDILNYKKGLSKEIIRILAGYFRVSQEAFNRPYTLKDHAIIQSGHITGRGSTGKKIGNPFAVSISNVS